jgi:hypothetical protein
VLPHFTWIGPLFFILLSFACTWAWIRWFRQSEKLTPKWRAGVFLAALCLATFSTALSIFLFVHARLTGGYPFYHPTELFCIRYGFLTAFLGMLTSLAGKRTFRLHVAALALVNLFLWLVDAAVQ